MNYKLKFNSYYATLVVVFLFFLNSCNYCPTSSTENELKEGDLLFQDLKCGALCEAINAVTDGVNGKDFSHCALVISVNDSLKVIEAIGSQVQITSLASFYKRSNDTATIENITVGRLKNKYKVLLPKAIVFAKNQLGQPYDDVFLMDNDKWYCSELVYEAFKTANGHKPFFELHPMTFKDPVTDHYFPAWISYYSDLKIEIPEGKPGTNPGQMSLSNKIDIVENVKIPK